MRPSSWGAALQDFLLLALFFAALTGAATCHLLQTPPAEAPVFEHEVRW
mgnify:CR=1 FL=1